MTEATVNAINANFALIDRRRQEYSAQVAMTRNAIQPLIDDYFSFLATAPKVVREYGLVHVGYWRMAAEQYSFIDGKAYEILVEHYDHHEETTETFTIPIQWFEDPEAFKAETWAEWEEAVEKDREYREGMRVLKPEHAMVKVIMELQRVYGASFDDVMDKMQDHFDKRRRALDDPHKLH